MPCLHVKLLTRSTIVLLSFTALLCHGNATAATRPDGSVVEWDRIEPALEMAAELVTTLPDTADVLPRPYIGSATDVLLQELLVGGQIDIDLPELGATGAATIIAVRPSPTIEPNDGTGRRLITSVYRHTAKTAFDVRLTGEESIGATGNHPFWSDDRQAFVRADELRIGERLRQASGATTTVVSVVQRPDPTPVYNIEVDAEHVYYVGTNGVLVHNAPCIIKPLPLSRVHGSPQHNSAINRAIFKFRTSGGVDFRKDQALVDVAGRKMTSLRPDLQWTDKYGIRHVLQVVRSNPTTHRDVFEALGVMYHQLTIP